MKIDHEVSKCAIEAGDEIEHVREVVDAAADIRAERVAAAKEALVRGTLPLRGKDLVDKMLRHMVQE
jgi:anti-sigma28 factor (negative regulator of flagellin synthesis)